jgi:predicted nucleic acid-binding protein
MSSNSLVLDANILIRAVLGNQVRQFLLDFHKKVNFFVPDVCFEDAEKYLPIIFEKRATSPVLGLEVLSKLQCLLQIIDKSVYQEYALKAQQRIKNRDIHDWPVIATAFAVDSPIWTEDQDFFGSGISVWTTDRIHLFFEAI